MSYIRLCVKSVVVVAWKTPSLWPDICPVHWLWDCGVLFGGQTDILFPPSEISPLQFHLMEKKNPLAKPHERKYSWMYYFKHAAVDLVVHVCADWQKTVYRKWELWRVWMCVPNSSASPAPRRPWGANIAGCCATFSWTRPSCLELATSLRTKPCLTLASTQLWRYEKKMIDCIEQENNTVFPERFRLLNYRVSL